MATELRIVEATFAHVGELEPHLREGELLELEAQGFESPVLALGEGLIRSAECYSVLYRGDVVAMFGVALERTSQTLLGAGELGALWFLTGQGFVRAAWHAVPLARRVLSALLERYGTLGTIIDARYAMALRWARHLGFELLPSVPHGPGRQPFHPAVLRSSR